MSIDQLKLDIAELEKREADILGQDTIDQDQLNMVRNRLSELNFEMEQQEKNAAAVAQINQAHQERVVQATDELADIIDNLDVGEGLTLRNYIENVSDYQLITIAIKQSVGAKLAAFSEIIKGYQEREVQYQRQNVLLQQNLQEAQQTSTQLAEEKSDFANKLFNATNELDKANAEIESLKAQLATKAKPAESAELTAEERAKRVLEKKAEITIYHVIPNRELNPTEFTATLAATGETIVFNWTQKGRYLVVDETTALQFRGEYEAATKPVAPDHHDDIALVSSVEAPTIPDVEPVVQFHQEDQVQPEGVPASTTVSESAAENDGQVSRQEFDALKVDVDTIKRQLGLAVA